jgi:hypothetical protein
MRPLCTPIFKDRGCRGATHAHPSNWVWRLLPMSVRCFEHSAMFIRESFSFFLGELTSHVSHVRRCARRRSHMRDPIAGSDTRPDCLENLNAPILYYGCIWILQLMHPYYIMVQTASHPRIFVASRTNEPCISRESVCHANMTSFRIVGTTHASHAGSLAAPAHARIFGPAAHECFARSCLRDVVRLTYDNVVV